MTWKGHSLESPDGDGMIFDVNAAWRLGIRVESEPNMVAVVWSSQVENILGKEPLTPGINEFISQFVYKRTKMKFHTVHSEAG